MTEIELSKETIRTKLLHEKSLLENILRYKEVLGELKESPKLLVDTFYNHLLSLRTDRDSSLNHYFGDVEEFYEEFGEDFSEYTSDVFSKGKNEILYESDSRVRHVLDMIRDNSYEELVRRLGDEELEDKELEDEVNESSEECLFESEYKSVNEQLEELEEETE